MTAVGWSWLFHCPKGQAGGGWGRLESGVSLPPGPLGSEKTPAASAVVKYFLLMANLAGNRTLWHNSKWFLPFPTTGCGRGLLSHMDCENLVESSGGESHKRLGAPMSGSLEFLTLRLVYTEPPRVCQLQFRFPNLALIPGEVDACGLGLG